jgi:hypothetical protein
MTECPSTRVVTDQNERDVKPSQEEICDVCEFPDSLC